jgi:outer membrane protein
MRVSVSRTLLLAAAALVALPTASFAQGKVAVIRIQEAIARCNDGQAAAKTLRDRFAPKQQELEKQQRDINDLQNQLKTQDKTLSDDARSRLLRSIDDKTRSLTRENEDAQAEAQQAEQDAINEIGRKMINIINDHAKSQGYSLVLDVSSPQTPVLFADQALDITEKIVEMYNSSAATSGSAAPSGTAPKPSATAPKAPATAPKPAEPKPAAKP